MDRVAAANALNVVARFFKRGNPVAITEDPAFTGIITRQRQIHSAVEHSQELPQILRASAYVLSGVKRTRYPETASRVRHQLHQSLGAFRTHNASVKVRLLFDDKKYQVRVDRKTCCILPDKLIDQGIAGRPAILFPGG